MRGCRYGQNGDLFGSIRGGVSGMDKSYAGGDNKSFAAHVEVLVTKTVSEEGCVSVRWHIGRRKRLARGGAFLFGVSVGKPPNLRARVYHTLHM